MPIVRLLILAGSSFPADQYGVRAAPRTELTWILSLHTKCPDLALLIQLPNDQAPTRSVCCQETLACDKRQLGDRTRLTPGIVICLLVALVLHECNAARKNTIPGRELSLKPYNG